MSFWARFNEFLHGPTLGKAVTFATTNGLTNDIIHLALQWVKVASKKFIEDTDKREYVVKILIGRRVPESVARIAVELAYQLYKVESK